MKLLSPAGNFESLKCAVYNGADEVYLGVNQFNARNNIDGFCEENLVEAVNFAHLYGVKVALAVNILFSDGELQSALDLIVNAYNVGVDAFIIQDLALAKLVSENYPEIVLHASTQMGLHNLEGVKSVLKFGFKRVVLARETPLSEIKRIKKECDVEIEYFAQGALCVSFSGNCYMSSYLHGASGNRGKCKQLCRLPYTLVRGGKAIKSGYLLSAKDFNLSARLGDLEDAGVDVLKIEGRARRPYYVAIATREYRRALDGKRVNDESLKLAFNRYYTQGYFNGNGQIISPYQSHIGICVGEVVKVKSGKRFNEVIFSSDRKLCPKSTFKFFRQGKEKDTITAFDLTDLGGGKYRATTTHAVVVGDKVNLISDFNDEKNVLSVVKKIKVDVNLSLRVGEPIKVTVSACGKSVTVNGEELSVALNYPLTKSEIEDNFSKSEYFYPQVTIEYDDGVFIAKQKLNEVRRTAFNALIDAITGVKPTQLERKTIKVNRPFIRFTDYVIIEDSKAFLSGAKLKEKNIVFDPDEYDESEVEKVVSLADRQGKNVYLSTPNFALKGDIELIKQIIKRTGVGVVANNYYALSLTDKTVIGGGLNVFNSVVAEYYGLPVMVAEDGVLDREDFAVMTLRHCPMKAHLNAECSRCPYKDGYVYRMESGVQFSLKRKKLCSCTFYLKTEKTN